MIGAVVRQISALFVDDGFLAAAILCAVGLIGALKLLGAAPAWLLGLMLALALPGTLVASVLRGARRKADCG